MSERLTIKNKELDYYYFDDNENDGYFTNKEYEVAGKLGQLEDIEEELNLYVLEENQRCLSNFLRLILAEEKGFYYKKDNEVHFCRWCIRVGLRIVETKPCYAVKETTLKSCYYGDVEEVKELADAHYWDWKTCLNFHLEDYGKTWALTREELEK